MLGKLPLLIALVLSFVTICFQPADASTKSAIAGKTISSKSAASEATKKLTTGRFGTVLPTRIINFPKEGLGYYRLSNPTNFMEVWPELEKGKPARGTVHVPANADVTLSTGWGDGAALSLLLRLRPQDIQGLTLDGSAITHESFKYIRHLKLKRLSLAGANIDDRDIAYVADAIPELEALDISYTHFSDQGMPSILKLRSLKKLVLWKDNVTDAGLNQLSKSTRLQDLNLRETPVSDTGLRYIGKIHSLAALNLASTQITGEGLRSLPNLQALQMLDLSGTNIDDTGLAELARMPNILCLNLSRTKVTDKGLHQLDHLLDLRKLWLRDLNRVSDSSIPILVRHKKLEDLEIQKTAISQNGVTLLAGSLPNSEIHSKSPCKCRKRTRVN